MEVINSRECESERMTDRNGLVALCGRWIHWPSNQSGINWIFSKRCIKTGPSWKWEVDERSPVINKLYWLHLDKRNFFSTSEMLMVYTRDVNDDHDDVLFN